VYPITVSNIRFQVYGAGLETTSINRVTLDASPTDVVAASPVDAGTPATLSLIVPTMLSAKFQYGPLNARFQIGNEISDWQQIAVLVPGTIPR
jgi:hypothetical protein